MRIWPMDVMKRTFFSIAVLLLLVFQLSATNALGSWNPIHVCSVTAKVKLNAFFDLKKKPSPMTRF